MLADLIKRFGLCAAVAVVAWIGNATQASAQGPSDFLSRLDTNKNGMLDPNEVEGRMGMFIQGIAKNNPRIDLKRPIPMSTLTAEFARMREERMRGGGPGGGPQAGGRGGGPGGRGGPGGGPQFGGRGGPQPGSRGGRGAPEPNPYEYRQTELEPLVPGFGIEDVFTPPLLFGAEADLFTIEVTDRDRQEAARAYRSYDRNNDGKITSEEMRRSRYGADLPMYDKNRDGVITMNEMEYRYARRRMENAQQTAAKPRSGRRDEKKDDDEENAFGYQWGDRKSYRRAPLIERLPGGLPDWFARDDGDADGQVAMMEFSTAWTDTVMQEFNQFDLNQDGLITPRECLKAVENGAIRGGSGDSSTDDSSDDSGAADADSSASTDSGGGAVASGSSESIKIDPKYYDYFKKVVQKYDTSNDGVLTANEWAVMSKDPSAADADGDGRISVNEYARWSMK